MKTTFKKSAEKPVNFKTPILCLPFLQLSLVVLLLSSSTLSAQKGYLYVHAQTLSEDLNQSFTYSVAGGPTSVSNFTLLDQALNIEPTDIGAGHGTGNGELWITAGSTWGTNGTVYHRPANSTTWSMVSGQSGTAIDGADLGHFVMANSSGDAYVYNGTSFIKIYDHSTYGSKAVDIANNGSITTATGYTAIVTANGHVWSYTGDYNSIFTWNDITPVDNSGKTFTRLDINPSTNDIILTDGGGYITKINSSGTGLIYYGTGAVSSASINDVAVDDNGNIYADGNDATGIGSVYRYNGSSWTEEPTAIHHFYFTCSDAGQAWTVTGITAAQQGAYATPSTIFTRTGDGSGTWLDDERVQASQNDNAIIIPVSAGTYTITQSNPSNYNLQGISIYDSTAGSSKNVASNTATIVVTAGQVVHVVFTNGLVSPTSLSLACGSTTTIENFGSGVSGTDGSALSGLTDYHYYNNTSENTITDGYYELTQSSSGWHNSSLTDHTGLTGGYFLIVNASFAPDMFYRRRITGLVPGTTYILSFWAANISNSSPLQPNIIAGITDTSSGSTIGSVTTGYLPTDFLWHQYTFSFIATTTTADIFLQNNAPGGMGNDLAIDDISISTVCSVLPQTIVNINAQKQNQQVLLGWSTTTVIGFKYFDIERSADGTHWENIGTVTSNSEDATAEQNYNFTDFDPLAGLNYYRLRGLTVTNETLVSESKKVQFNQTSGWSVSVYPNPATTSTTVTLKSDMVLQAVRVFDLNGKIIMIKNLNEGTSIFSLDIRSFAAGAYFVQATNVSGNTNTAKFIIKN
ncbi:MAG TPA: T9SS type A sorting domain-containing protein [Puia sp.]|nr:T9SS type A sorting domain-containing protein [Puia sp.]